MNVKILKVTVFFIIFCSNIFAQKNCDNYKKVPKEFYRSGYYESNMNAGFPYGAAFYATKEEGLLNCSMTAFRLSSMTVQYFLSLHNFLYTTETLSDSHSNSFSSLFL